MTARAFKHCAPAVLLDAVGGDRIAFAALLRQYLGDAGATTTRWRATASMGDPARLAALCHELRGSAVLLGAGILQGRLIACEMPARAGAMPGAVLHIAVDSELAALARELRRALEQFGQADDVVA